jgi:hypothetical protein
MPLGFLPKMRKFRSFLIEILIGGPFGAEGVTICGTEGMPEKVSPQITQIQRTKSA